MPSNVKITDAPVGQIIGVEYSDMSPFSYENKWLLLTHPNGFFGLYTGRGVFQRLLPAVIDTSSRPRWSRIDPDRLTYFSGSALMGFVAGIDAGVITYYILHTFTEYMSIDDKGEAEISFDGTHRVIAGVNEDASVDVFAFDMVNMTKGQVFKQTEPFDGLKIAANNHIILSRKKPKDPALVKAGVQYGIWDLDASLQLLNQDGHACVGVDVGGEPVLLVTNSDENPVTLTNFTNGVVKVRIADGKQMGLISFPWSDAVDITKPDGGSFCHVSTYGSKENSGRLYQVALDGSYDRILLDNINHNVSSYEGQPKASISRDGTLLVYSATEPDGVTVNTWLVVMDISQLGQPTVNVLTEIPDKAGEIWQVVGSLPYDESSDVVCFSSVSKNMTIYRRK